MEARDIPVHCRAMAVTALRRTGDKGEVLLLKRQEGFPPGAWSQIGGLIEAGEIGWQAALRELHQETSIIPASLYTADFTDAFYNSIQDTMELLPIFVALVEGDHEIKLNKKNDEYKWVDIKEAAEIVPYVGQRRALREIERDFIQHDPAPWKMMWKYEGAK